jgi:hypothetical protein
MLPAISATNSTFLTDAISQSLSGEAIHKSELVKQCPVIQNTDVTVYTFGHGPDLVRSSLQVCTLLSQF